MIPKTFGNSIAGGQIVSTLIRQEKGGWSRSAPLKKVDIFKKIYLGNNIELLNSLTSSKKI